MGRSPEQRVWVGFDLGGSKMLSVVFDSALNTLGKQRRKTRGLGETEIGIDRVVETIRESLVEAQAGRDQLAGVGVGVPGPLDLDAGILLNSPNLGWTQVPLKDILERELGCAAVVMNDVDAGLYGEYRFGAGRGGRCVLGVFPGTGIGGGCVYEGKILRGRTSSCMEIGHIQVMPGGPLCGCGQEGCLEAIASRLAIAADAAKAVHRGEAPGLEAAAGSDIAAIRSGALARSIASGDAVIEQIVRRAAGYIGVAVAGAIHLLAPDIVVLGGGLVEAMPELFVTEVENTARGRVMPSYADSFRVLAAELGDDAAAMGAAAWAQQLIPAHWAPA